jgi:ATP-dependent DNA ligase
MNEPAGGFPLPLDTAPMEARLVAALPDGPGWQFEPKWVGFRCLAFRAGDRVDLRAKSGKPLARYFPEIVTVLQSLGPEPFVLDGELAVPAAVGLSFDALQMRLHPSKRRVQKLAAETPATMILFDILASPDGALRLEAPLSQRRPALVAFHRSLGPHSALRLSPATRDPEEARRWLAASGGAFDSVIAKEVDGILSLGRTRDAEGQAAAFGRLRRRRFSLRARHTRTMPKGRSPKRWSVSATT